MRRFFAAVMLAAVAGCHQAPPAPPTYTLWVFSQYYKYEGYDEKKPGLKPLPKPTYTHAELILVEEGLDRPSCEIIKSRYLDTFRREDEKVDQARDRLIAQGIVYGPRKEGKVQDVACLPPGQRPLTRGPVTETTLAKLTADALDGR